ncbi:general transcription factor IIH subunit 1-like [Watersipora subatra]|uniref:general transcription factor IIH subunit 1-like n=1 Tax=Watersipora subatra TaxID=2589382 RepID=UPI00355B50A2
MASSSEDVLLIVPSVWHKKSSGSLYLMAERVAWMSGSKEVFTISHNYIDIKIQKISPDTKEKVQLQLVMHNGEANTFHFRNEGGRGAQVRDREKVKELLQKLLPQFRSKINSELEMKHKMLQEDKQLFQLYNDLVVSGVISAEEFWSNRSHLTKEKISDQNQNIGVSPSFLSEIKPTSDGSNSISYNLTSDMIDSIFRTYPQVKKKHFECVPHEMCESEFWTKFFQSHYYHRDRINLGSKDVFTDCAKTDDTEMAKDLMSEVAGGMVDMTSLADNPIGEDFGESATNDLLGKASSTAANSNQTIIKRFNHHSTRILKTAEEKSRQHATEEPSRPENTDSQANKRKMEELTTLEDLQSDAPHSKKSQLSLSKVSRYFHGPVADNPQPTYRSTESMMRAANALVQEVEQWSGDIKNNLTSDVARDILTQLSPGGTLMQGMSLTSMSDLVPGEIRAELKNLYCALNELLRHFWACFPTQTKQLEEKLVKMEQNLQRFTTSKLQPFKEKIHHYSFSFNLTDHMESQLSTAIERYQKWISKRNHKSLSSIALKT